MKHYRTQRGFILVEFADDNGAACTLQESSDASDQCIWLGKTGEGKRMHLNRDQVAAILPFLQQFVDEGFLPMPPEESG